MPNYTKKKKREEFEIVALNKECSEVLQRKLPPKLKDFDYFIIPRSIGTSFSRKVFCDLGTSINLMSLLIYKRLGLGEVKPTTVSNNWQIDHLFFPKERLKTFW